MQSSAIDHYAMLRNVSRTFALSIEQLPPILRETITVAYLLFRIADCIEDHPVLTREHKARLLRLWAEVLSGTAPVQSFTLKIEHLDGNNPEVAVAQQAGSIMERLHLLPVEPAGILAHHVQATSLGMARWQEHGPYVQDEAEMDDYMHEVAGRVGYLLTDVFSWHVPAIRRHRDTLLPLGREFGLALQTVNIIRGMRKDYERGWVFVPVSFYTKAGLSRDGLFDPAQADRALQVVARLADKALRHLQNGLTYITLLPRRQQSIRLFCIWPLLFAVKTLAISRNNPAVLTAEAKITRSQVEKIVIYSRLFFWSNFCLKAYYKSLLTPEHA